MEGRKERERKKEMTERRKGGRKKLPLPPTVWDLTFSLPSRKMFTSGHQRKRLKEGATVLQHPFSLLFFFSFFFFSPSFLFPNENTDVDGSRIRTTWKQRNCRKSVDGEDHDVQEVRSQIVLHLHLFLLRT